MYELTLKVSPKEGEQLDRVLWEPEAVIHAIDPDHNYVIEVTWKSEGRGDRAYPSEYGSEELCPVTTSLATLAVMTESQKNRIEELIRSYNANSVIVTRDNWNTENLLFALYKGSEQSASNVIVNGLIEADGRSHT